MNDEERIWRNRVDERFVNLTTAQEQTQQRLDSIDETIYALDKVIRGDLEKDSDGVISRLHAVENLLTKYEAVLFQDKAGTKGLVHQVDALISGKMDAMERRRSRASVLIAIITSIALVVTNLDRIGEFWIKIFGKGRIDLVEQKLERAEHPRVTKVKVRRVIDYSEPASPP